MSEKTITTQELTNQPLSVEPAKPTDAETIFNVHRLTWLATYPNEEAGITEEDIRVKVEGQNGELIPQKIERWRKGIENKNSERGIFVVRSESSIIGFVAPTVRYGQRRVGAIYVLPEMQGKGVGGKLLDKAIEWHGRDDDIFVHVASYNQNAIDFYKRNGFKQTDKKVTDEAAQLGNGKEIPEIEMVLRADSR